MRAWAWAMTWAVLAAAAPVGGAGSVGGGPFSATPSAPTTDAQAERVAPTPPAELKARPAPVGPTAAPALAGGRSSRGSSAVTPPASANGTHEAERAAALLNYFRYSFATSDETRQREYDAALARAEEAGLVGRLHLAMLELARDEPADRARTAKLLEQALERTAEAGEAEQPLLDLAYFTAYVLRSLEHQNRQAARQAERASRLEEKVKALISIEEGLRERLQQQGLEASSPLTSLDGREDARR